MAEATIGSMFTGVGALCELAVAPLLDGGVLWHCDNDPAASKVLAHRFPNTPNLGDITALDWSTVEPVDVLAGGFPCQDISSAGRRAGIEGKRSGLWSCFVDAIRVLRPRLVLMENVSALVVRGLDRVLADLASLGFDAEWAVIRASDVGAPHRRERVFLAAADTRRDPWAQDHQDVPSTPRGGGVAAYAASQGRGPLEPEHVSVHRGAAVQSGQAESGRRGCPAADAGGIQVGEQPVAQPGRGSTAVVGLDRPTTADPYSDGCTRRRDPADAPAGESDLAWGGYQPAVRRWERALGRVAPPPAVIGKRGGRQLNPVFVEWMMGLPEGHVTAVPGLSRNAMLRLLGNGVLPQQATVAFEHLLARLVASGGRAA